MMPRIYIEILKMQNEVQELKNKIKGFEEMCLEIEKENQIRLKEAEEAQLKATQLQETIERFLSTPSRLLLFIRDKYVIFLL